MSSKFIDVEDLIRSKNPKLLKWLPKFIIRYLKRILHQEEVNAFIDKNKDKDAYAFCDAVIEEFNIKIIVEHIERIPNNGKIVLAMNHPLGGMDAMILVTALKEKRKDIKFIVNDLLMNLHNLKDIFVGVDKFGSNKDLIEKIDSLFKSDNAIAIFPAGMVSRKFKGKIQDFEWRKTFVTYAKKNEQDIVPIYIDGKLSKFFYRLYSIRKFFGIKANIEMLYLANEMFKQRNKTLKFIIGEPIRNAELTKVKNDNAFANEIREKVYQLNKK